MGLVGRGRERVGAGRLPPALHVFEVGDLLLQLAELLDVDGDVLPGLVVARMVPRVEDEGDRVRGLPDDLPDHGIEDAARGAGRRFHRRGGLHQGTSLDGASIIYAPAWRSPPAGGAPRCTTTGAQPPARIFCTASPTPVRLSPAMIPAARTMRKRAVQFGATLVAKRPRSAPRNMEIELYAGITMARPTLAGLGTQTLNLAGTSFSSSARTKPAALPMPRATRAPGGMASMPFMKISATAFHWATAGAGHSSVISIE